MNSEDRREIEAERAASPERFEEYEEAYLEKEREDAAIEEAKIRRQDHYARHHPHPHRSTHADGQSPTETNESAPSRTSSYAASTGVQYEPMGGGQGHREFRRQLTRSATTTSRINVLEQHPTALERIETHRTQHESTVGGTAATATRTTSSRRSQPLPPFGAGKTYPPMLPAAEEYVVEFDGHDDPLHAQNWPLKKKLRIGSVVAYFSLSATVGSSIFSNATSVIARNYGVSNEVGTLATSLFVLGYA
jgi:DHA1 family multidrug resistance protein-like MFS transporter